MVKQALVVARLDANDYLFIQDSVKGILFLSTPHRGSDSVRWPLLLANVVKASLSLGSGLSVRNDLLESLKRNSEELQGISINFRNQVKEVKIISCYEQSTTYPFGSRIVDQNTGVLGFPNETLIPMSGCDHHTVCRFPSEDDQNYQMILYELKNLIPLFSNAAIHRPSNLETAFLTSESAIIFLLQWHNLAFAMKTTSLDGYAPSRSNSLRHRKCWTASIIPRLTTVTIPICIRSGVSATTMSS